MIRPTATTIALSQNGIAPAPAQQLVLGQRADRQEDRGGDDQAGLRAAEREAR